MDGAGESLGLRRAQSTDPPSTRSTPAMPRLVVPHWSNDAVSVSSSGAWRFLSCVLSTDLYVMYVLHFSTQQELGVPKEQEEGRLLSSCVQFVR